MVSLTQWKVPAAVQPRAEDYGFDLDRTLSSIVGVHSTVPGDAFTAETLGTERVGNGVVIDDNLVLTIGYLVTEAETIWLHYGDGRVAPGHLLGYDQETGFGLIQALSRLELDPIPLGSSAAAEVGDRVVLGGVGGRTRSIAARVAGKQEFAGHWEYALDEVFFTYPAHPNWGGAGLLNTKGELIGVGSLQIERDTEGKKEHLNMVVPIDALKPILDDLRKFGQVNKPPRPWLGMYTAEIDGRLVIVGVSPRGPAGRADLKTGDIILAINNERVSTQIGFYRKVWSLGPAGIHVPLTIYRDGATISASVHSADRARMMKAPKLH